MPRDMEETVKLSRLGRTAEVRASTVNEDERTVEMVWTTGAAVKRYMPGIGACMEELEVSEAAINMERLNNGAPLLNSHWDYDTRDVIGVVEEAWLDGEVGYARVRFSAREDVDQNVWRDVRDGIIRNVSVGYSVQRYEVIEEDGALPRVVAREWTPMEISAVAIGADDMAGFRSEKEENPCRIDRATPANPDKETPMSEDNKGAAPEGGIKEEERKAAPAPAPQPEAKPEMTDAQRKQERAAERQRIADIRSVGVKLRIDEAEITKAVDEDMTIDQARAHFIDKMADGDDEGGETRSRVTIGRDEGETFRAMVQNALEYKLTNERKHVLEGNEMAGRSLLRIGEEILRRRGEKVSDLSDQQIAAKMLERGFHSTSDFPLALANVMGKRLRDAYENKPQTFSQIVRRATLPDFKTVKRIQIGDFPSLQEQPENAELKYGTVSESQEQYSLATYSRGVRFSRQAIINDDLDAFDRVIRSSGRAAARLESQVVWSILTDNPNMADGTALFHADHGNLVGAGSAISIDALGAAKALMRKQTNSDGELIDVAPAYLVVPSDLETVALQYVNSTYTPNEAGKVNPMAGAFNVIVEERLASLANGSASAWYLFADPSDIDTIEIGYLEGEQGPQLEQEESFSTDGLSLKTRLDFGAKAIDWRGMVKNPG